MTYRELLNLLLLGNEWGDIENKPSTFPPSQHTHKAGELELSEEQKNELKGDKGDTGPAGPAGPAGKDGKAGAKGEDGKDAPKHVLLFTCPDNDNAMHLEIQYKEASEASGEEAAAEEAGSDNDKGFKPLVKTSDSSTEGGESGKKAKVKGYTGDSWIDCPATGFGSNFGGWPVMVDLTDVSEIDVSKIYYIRYRWVAKVSNGSGSAPAAIAEDGTSSNGEMASDWYSMVYPCATEAPVTSSPSASLPPIAEMKEGSVLVFEKGKYQAITYQEFQKKLSENGSSKS